MNKPFHKRAAESLKEALDQFGTYAYNDKGADEVMDVGVLVKEIKKMPVDKAISELQLLLKEFVHKNADTSDLVSSIMMDLQEHPGFDPLFEDEVLSEHF